MLPLHFAPLQGYTEAPYRRIHQEVCGGIEAYYTPFIRLEHGSIRRKDLREALPEQNVGIHVIPQLIAADACEFNVLSQQLISDLFTNAHYTPMQKATTWLLHDATGSILWVIGLHMSDLHKVTPATRHLLKVTCG